MDDEREEMILEALQKMSDLQLKTLTRVTKLQAQVVVLETLLKTVLREQGANPESVETQCRELFAKLDGELQDSLKTWLAERDIATPTRDDPWWDKPTG